jgi:hypothetical protein
MKRKTPRGISYIVRDKTYRVQLFGSYVGQRRTFAEAAALLLEAQRDLPGTMVKYEKELPQGITYVRNRDSYRVRIKGKHVIQCKSLEKANTFNNAVKSKLKDFLK